MIPVVWPYLWESSECVESGPERHASCCAARPGWGEPPGVEAAERALVSLERRHAAHVELEVAPPVEAHAALRVRPHRHAHAPAVD